MKMITLAAALLLTVPAFAQQTSLTESQKTLYAIGVLVAQRSQLQSLDLSAQDMRYVMMGFKDSLLNKKLQATPQAYRTQISAFAQKKMAATAAKEKIKSKDYLEKMAKEPGAQRFPSGLIYIPIKEGTGASPTASDTVKVDYEGKLINGTVFDSSYERHQPAEFPLDGVIPCWTEGLQKMKVGGSATLVCPSDIAYGDTGHPPTIPGGATLTFKVELLEIVKAPAGGEKP